MLPNVRVSKDFLAVTTNDRMIVIYEARKVARVEPKCSDLFEKFDVVSSNF